MKKVLVLISVIALATACSFSFKIGGDDESVDTEAEVDHEASEGPSDEVTVDDIREALAKKHSDWDVDVMAIDILSGEAEYATGTVGEGPGGGSWFAAIADGEWEIVWDGNGIIFCSDLEGYDFPASMIPECWDDETQESVVR